MNEVSANIENMPSESLFDMRLKRPSKGMIVGMGVGFYPLLLLVQPVAWLVWKARKRAPWEIIVARGGAERADYYATLTSARRAAADLETSGARRMLNRRWWTPIEVMITVGAFTIFASPIENVLSSGQVISVALSMACILLAFAAYKWSRFSGREPSVLDEATLAAMTFAASAGMIGVSLFGSERIGGAILLLTAGLLGVESKKRIASARALRVVSNPDLVARLI